MNALAEQVGGFGEPHNRHEKAEDDQPAPGKVNVQGDAVEARGVDFLPAGLSARRAAKIHGQNRKQQQARAHNEEQAVTVAPQLGKQSVPAVKAVRAGRQGQLHGIGGQPGVAELHHHGLLGVVVPIFHGVSFAVRKDHVRVCRAGYRRLGGVRGQCLEGEGLLRRVRDGLGGRLRNRYGNGGFVGCFRHRLCGGLRNGLGLRHHLLRQAGRCPEHDGLAVGIPVEFPHACGVCRLINNSIVLVPEFHGGDDGVLRHIIPVECVIQLKIQDARVIALQHAHRTAAAEGKSPLACQLRFRGECYLIYICALSGNVVQQDFAPARFTGRVAQQEATGFKLRQTHIIVGLIQNIAIPVPESHAGSGRIRQVYRALFIGFKADYAIANVGDIANRFDAVHAFTGVFRVNAHAEYRRAPLRDGVIGARVRLRRCLRLFRDGQDVFIRAADGEGIKFGVRQIFRAAGFQHVPFRVLQHVARQRRVEHAVKPAGLSRNAQVVHGRPRNRLRHAAQVRLGIVPGDTASHGFTVRTDISVPQLLHGDVVQSRFRHADDGGGASGGSQKHQGAQSDGKEFEYNIVFQIIFLLPFYSPVPTRPSDTAAPRG